jgi:4-hydroxybenzoate polyprenyltransferase
MWQCLLALVSRGVAINPKIRCYRLGSDAGRPSTREQFLLLSTRNCTNVRSRGDHFLKARWFDYVKLVRFPYHLSFIGVVLGIVIINHHWSPKLMRDLFLLYVSFNVLLYGGLYTINGITDAEADRLHPLKRNRPIASGAVSSGAAATFAFVLIASGFLTGWAWFGLAVMPVYLLVMALNVSYSLLFRNIPVADIFLNAATHPPRFWLGLWLAGGNLVWGWLALVFLFATGISASRRSVELDRGSLESRVSLKKYSTRNLLIVKFAGVVGILLLWRLDRSSFQLPYIVTFCAYLMFVLGFDHVPGVRLAFEKLWQM